MKEYDYYFFFDVESIGLYGEAFSVGYVVLDRQGNKVEEAEFSCEPELVFGREEDFSWVKENCLVGSLNCNGAFEVRVKFLTCWAKWKDKGSAIIADCCFPVETNFLQVCVRDNYRKNKDLMPYPLFDFSSILLFTGCDPIGNFDRTEYELPKHNSLNDARQTARLFKEIILKIK